MHKLVRISGIIARYKPEPWYLVKVLDCNIVGNRKRSEKYQNTSDDRQKAQTPFRNQPPNNEIYSDDQNNTP